MRFYLIVFNKQLSCQTSLETVAVVVFLSTEVVFLFKTFAASCFFSVKKFQVFLIMARSRVEVFCLWSLLFVVHER